MKNNFIEEMYYGRINPSEKRYHISDEYKNALKMVSNTEKQLKEMLSNQELKLFDDFVNAINKVNIVENLENFKIGFMFGVLMMCDCFGNDENKR